jgi:hypothetical protein
MKPVRAEENRTLIQRTSFSYQKLPYRVLQAARNARFDKSKVIPNYFLGLKSVHCSIAPQTPYSGDAAKGFDLYSIIYMGVGVE